MKHLSWLTFAGVAFAALAGAAGGGIGGGNGSNSDEPEKQRARAKLIAEHAAVAPGQTAYLGVSFEIDAGWHIYWDGAGDTGMPVQVELQLPEGYTAGEILWPAPKRHVSPGDLLDYIYEDRVTLLVPVTVPADAKAGERVRISAQLDWLECKDYCLPGASEVELVLPVAPDAGEKSADALRFDEARKRVPRPLPTGEGAGVEAAWKGDRLTVRAEGATAMSYYPKSGAARLVDPIRDGAGKGDTLSMEFEPGLGGQTRVAGVLEISYPEGRESAIYTVELPGPASR